MKAQAASESTQLKNYAIKNDLSNKQSHQKSTLPKGIKPSFLDNYLLMYSSRKNGFIKTNKQVVSYK